MAGTKEIKRRIRSTKSTQKITKAMELVSAAKMKRAVGSTLASRLYASYAWHILESLKNTTPDNVHPLLKERTGDNILIVLISSNRGLAGAYNTQIMKKVLGFMRDNAGKNLSFITVGKKGDAIVRRFGGNIIASFTELPDNISVRDTMPITSLVFGEFLKGTYDKVYVAYTEYISALKQDPRVQQVLPIGKKDLEHLMEDEMVNEKNIEYLFEPDYDKIVPPLIEKISRMQMYQMMIESLASEHSSRMVAMKNAKEAAGEIIDELTLSFNKARQASITQEISEISAGMASSVA